MAKLVVSLDGDVLGYHFLDKERFLIGRKPQNDIQLNDASVSKEHAAILIVGNDQILEDLGSTNGTLVNGSKVKRHILQNNDLIEIGRYQLKYVNQKAQTGMDFDRTMIMPALNLKPAVGPMDTQTRGGEQVDTAVSVARAANSNFPLGGVKGTQGSHAGQTLELSRPLATFGRAGVQVAVINRRPHGYYITHVEGKKHALVNGQPIGDGAQALQEGDRIEVAEDKLVFFLKK